MNSDGYFKSAVRETKQNKKQKHPQKVNGQVGKRQPCKGTCRLKATAETRQPVTMCGSYLDPDLNKLKRK